MALPPQFRLDGRVALVTGGGRGIGRATALALADAGAAVVVTARSTNEINTVAAQIEAGGGRALAIAADVAQRADVERLAASVFEAFGRLDVLVNNAGVLQPIGTVWTVDPDAWAYTVDVNLKGVFYCTRAFLPSMIERGAGRIINVSTGAARTVVSHWSAYGASKAGVDHFTRILAEEVKEFGIAANGVYPGLVDTEMQAEIRETPPEVGGTARHEWAWGNYRAGNLRPPEHPARLILWLAAAAPADVTGQTLVVGDEAVERRVLTDLEEMTDEQ